MERTNRFRLHSEFVARWKLAIIRTSLHIVLATSSSIPPLFVCGTTEKLENFRFSTISDDFWKVSRERLSERRRRDNTRHCINMRIYATIIIDGNIAITTEKLGDMWETLNIPNTEEYTDAKEEIVRNLIA